MVMAWVTVIACGYEDANDLDRLRHDPLMKLAVGSAERGALATQSTICPLRIHRARPRQRGCVQVSLTSSDREAGQAQRVVAHRSSRSECCRLTAQHTF